MFSKVSSKWFIALAAVLGSVALAPVWAVNPGSATTTTGQPLNIQIDAPLDGATVTEGPLTVSGRTSIGALSGNTSVLYVVDNSASTNGSGLDCNNDGVVDAGDNADATTNRNGSILDCELIGVAALNESLSGGGVSVGLITFAGSAVLRDVNPIVEGVQAFTTPAADLDGNGVRDIPQAGRLLPFNSGTAFNPPLALMNSTFATRPADEQKIAFFLSDGAGTLSTGSTSPLGMAVAAGTRVFTFAVNQPASECNVGQPLRTIADMTGGTCTVVTNPTTLTASLVGATPAGIDFVEVSVDGLPAMTATLGALGNFTADTSLTGQGPHQIAATVFANDGTRAVATVDVLASGTAPAADLSIAKTAALSTVTVSENVAYTLAVRNAGPADASGVVVTDTIPSATSFVSAGASQGGCAFIAPTLSCNLGALASGAEASITLVVRANSPGAITNTAAVSAQQRDENTANNASTATVTVLDPQADLRIGKSAAQGSVLVADNIRYTLAVSNVGPGNATGVVVRDNIPASTSFVSASATQGSCTFAAPTVTCHLNSIANGGSASITLVVKANASGSIVNTASVNGGQTDPAPGNNSANATVTAIRRTATMSVQPALLSALSGSLLQLHLRFEARLVEGAAGVPGKPIEFVAGTQRCSATTDAAGKATCALTLSRTIATVLRFGYEARFAGDVIYLPAAGRGPVVQALRIPVF